MILLLFALACSDGQPPETVEPSVPQRVDDCTTCDADADERCAECDQVHDEDEACDADAVLQGDCGGD